MERKNFSTNFHLEDGIMQEWKAQLKEAKWWKRSNDVIYLIRRISQHRASRTL